MPHQCLSCGHLFAEGSAAILQGCPDCKGTRFFYTEAAVDPGERKRIADQAQKDLRNVVAEMLQEAHPEAAKELQAKAGEDGWASLKPRDLKRLVRKIQAEQEAADKTLWENPDAEPVLKGATKENAARRLAALASPEVDEKPDTVTIHKPGSYEIDVKGLLERHPIVVQKDGTYLIHLPSLFDGKK